MDGFGFSSAVGGSTGGGIIEKTYAEILTLMGSSGLTAGSFYKITDRGDRWLLFQAVSTIKLATDGQRLMLCPADYAVETDAYGNNWIGVFYPTIVPVANDLCIWGGQVWKNNAGVAGVPINDVTLSVDWTLITKTGFLNHEYTEMLFGCCYDFVNDYTVKQWDEHDNEFVYNSDLDDYNNCDISDWNYDHVFISNHCRGIYNNTCGDIFHNMIMGAIHGNSNTHIIYNLNTSDIFNNSNYGVISNNSNGVISNNSNDDAILGNSNNGCITDNSNYGIIYRNSNNGDIINNSNTGAISLNQVLGNITNNSNVGDIDNNRNTGDINNNSHNDDIIGNINNGDIFSCTGTGKISYNTNNGSISGNHVSDVTDPIIDK